MTLENYTARAPMPDAQKILFQDYPRDAWSEHPNFKQKTMNWMNAHQGFKGLAEICCGAVEFGLDKKWSEEKVAQYLGYYGNMMVQSLHGHHNWEDRSFFPEIIAADSRAEAGLDLLESDHQELDMRLDTITHQANRVLKLTDLDPTQLQDELGLLQPELKALGKLLERHLEDEEDLIVPIIIHNKLRG